MIGLSRIGLSRIGLSRRMALLAALLASSVAASAQPAAPVSVEQAWARATPGAAQDGALYITLRAAIADRLSSISTPVAGMAMLHESREVDGVMQMRELPGLALPAGRLVAMRPGGIHVMLMQLAHPLLRGQRFPVTLTFDQAPPLTVLATVAPAGAGFPDGGPP